MKHPSVPSQGATLGAKRSSAEYGSNAGLGKRSQGVHGHRCTEGCRAVGAGPHAALDLQAGDAAPQVRQVHPEHPLGFCVVQWDAVDGDVDAALVDPTNAKGSVTHAMACVGRDHRRRGEPQQKGHVLRSVLGLDVRSVEVGDRERIVFPGLHGRDRCCGHLGRVDVQLGQGSKAQKEKRKRRGAQTKNGWLCHRVDF